MRCQKTRIGDWEGDTIIGKDHKGVLVTLAERKSRFVLAGQLPGKQADGVAIKIGELLAAHLDKCITMTFNNGKEFAEHEQLAKNLNVDIYFAHPYHSWERDLNENNNGLLRQYFPKNKALAEVTEDEVLKAVERLNHRPRKVLGYRTPHEVFFGVQKTYTKPLGSVALQD
ncbi:MAG TPA: IS30 family transposase [Nitrosomonas sp.]|nr:IS30 family transposase [Nitrosomonas sp.]